MRFFTSDLHFGHKNIIEFCKRPWPDVDAMNRGIIDRWNRTVSLVDDVFCLGDMFFCGSTKAKGYMSKLNGRKYLIQGNHDWGKVKAERANEFGFEWVQRYQHCIRIGNEDVVLCHFPYDGDHTNDMRFLELRPPDNGQWLLHGHVHCEWQVKERQINVGVDVWDFSPVPEWKILEIMKSYK